MSLISPWHSIEGWNPARKKELESTVVESWWTRVVRCIAPWDKENHPLASSRQDHPVGILQVKSPRLINHGLPFCAFEALVHPRTIFVVEVSIPTCSNPIQFQALDRKLARHILQVVRGSNICVVIQKPVNRIKLCLDVNPFWPKALST